MNRPLIAIPLGDPAGIGPEITVKAVLDKETIKIARCVVVGDKKVIEDALNFTSLKATINCIEKPSLGNYSEKSLML